MDTQRIPRLLETEARDGCRLWLRYDDGTAGEADLSSLAGHGVFAAWNDPQFFASARLTPEGAVVWGDDEIIDACPDALYFRLTEGRFPLRGNDGKEVGHASEAAARAYPALSGATLKTTWNGRQ